VSHIVAVLLAFTVAFQGPQVPAPTGFVSDFANVIPEADRVRMTRLIETVQAGSQGEIAVVTLADLEGRDVNEVALRIAREWGVGAKAGIGDRARNAGVVVLLVPRETNQDGRGYIRIEVGNGAEGFITDATSGDMIREATPLLQQRQYGPALSLITARLSQRYAAEFQFSLDSTLVPKRRARKQQGIPPIVYIMVFFVIMSLLQSRGRRGRGVVVVPFPIGRGGGGGWGGGFGGGGFGGGGGGFGGFGGGGGFSGGGSSGSF
jgi:uncharacterized protein